MIDLWPWVPLALLGAYHGINPGMGWLFAVARGLQEQRRSAVLRALLPIAIGHEAAIGLVVLLVAVLQVVASPVTLRLLAALCLAGMALYRLLRPLSHPKGFGMRMTGVRLGAWSFLMSSAHGAGLMLVPLLFAWPVSGHTGGLSDPELSLGASTLLFERAIAAASIHTLTLLVVMGVVAVIVYEKLGLRLLRRAWFNLDLAWAVALFGAGAITLFT